MASMRWILTLATATVCVGFQQYVPPSNPHALASTCLVGSDSDGAEVDCGDVCTQCHLSATADASFYDVGDAAICGECHADRTRDERAAGDLLVSTEHGNHAVAVPYRATNLRSRLAAQPVGPRLFRDGDGGTPRMFCSTCHDPHGNRPGLMRTEGEICRACHVM
jgi:predicted CXXCH cytochrome family protein